MAIRTMTVGSGTGADFSIGWKELVIKKAAYGDYNGNRYLDVWFEGYPDNLNCRVYEAINMAGGIDLALISKTTILTQMTLSSSIISATGQALKRLASDDGNW